MGVDDAALRCGSGLEAMGRATREPSPGWVAGHPQWSGPRMGRRYQRGIQRGHGQGRGRDGSACVRGVLCHHPGMEQLWLVAAVALGVVVGAALTQLTVILAERRQRRQATDEYHRSLYARTLATYDTAYRLVDFLITWPRTHREASGGERTSARTGATLSEASAELSSLTRRSRELVSELRLAGRADVVPYAVALHDAMEEASMALRVDTPAKLERRWSVVAPNWRSAREGFAEAARQAVER